MKLMECRYCLKYALGYCVRYGGRKADWKEPLFLTLPDGRRFRLEFCCDKKDADGTDICGMNVYSDD